MGATAAGVDVSALLGKLREHVIAVHVEDGTMREEAPSLRRTGGFPHTDDPISSYSRREGVTCSQRCLLRMFTSFSVHDCTATRMISRLCRRVVSTVLSVRPST